MMKKLTIISLLICTIVTKLNAQKSSILLSGDFTFKSTKQNNYNSSFDVVKRNVLLVSPVIGYQFNNNWTAGVAMSIGSGKAEGVSYPQSNVYTLTQKENLFLIGPMIRYTQKISNVLSFYTQLQGTFGNDKIISTNSTSTTTDELKVKLTNILLTPAVFINLKNNFGFNISFGGFTYQEIKYDNQNPGYDATKSSGFEFTLGKTVNIGISKNFTVK